MLEYQKPGYQKEATIQAELYVACKKAGLRLLDEFKSNLTVFFAMLNAQIDYRKGGGLDAQKGPVHVTHTISSYQNRQDHIDEKLS